jgi:hypothetical protein
MQLRFEKILYYILKSPPPPPSKSENTATVAAYLTTLFLLCVWQLETEHILARSVVVPVQRSSVVIIVLFLGNDRIKKLLKSHM